MKTFDLLLTITLILICKVSYDNQALATQPSTQKNMGFSTLVLNKETGRKEDARQSLVSTLNNSGTKNKRLGSLPSSEKKLEEHINERPKPKHSQNKRKLSTQEQLSLEDIKNLIEKAQPLKKRKILKIDQDNDVIYFKTNK